MNLQFPVSAPNYPPPGHVVWVPTHLLWRHRGIVSDRWHMGAPMVISASARAGRVREEPWAVFAGGRPVWDEGYPSQLPNSEVMRRARSLIGSPYRLLAFNCDHFVAFAHGEDEPQSSQVGVTLAVALVAVVIGAASSRQSLKVP